MLNPQAPAFQPQSGVPLPMYLNVPRPQRRRRRRNQNQRRPRQNPPQNNGQIKQVANALGTQINKLAVTVNKMQTEQKQQAQAPQLNTAPSTAAPSLLVKPESENDVRLHSHKNALDYMFRHLTRVLRTGSGSIIGAAGEIEVRLTFPSNQVSTFPDPITLIRTGSSSQA